MPPATGKGRNVAAYQPVTLAATEGLFETSSGAPLAILGQPDTASGVWTIRFSLPKVLSFLTYRHWPAEVKGLKRVSARSVAGQCAAAVLQLPHHGGAGNDLHRASR